MSKIRMVNRGVDTLVLNGYYTDERGKVVKRELDELLALQLEEWKRAAQGIGDLQPTSLTSYRAREPTSPVRMRTA